MAGVRIFWNQIVVVVAQHCKYTKCHSTVLFKWLLLCYMKFTSIINQSVKTEPDPGGLASPLPPCPATWVFFLLPEVAESLSPQNLCLSIPFS